MKNEQIKKELQKLQELKNDFFKIFCLDRETLIFHAQGGIVFEYDIDTIKNWRQKFNGSDLYTENGWVPYTIKMQWADLLNEFADTYFVEQYQNVCEKIKSLQETK